MVDNKKDILCPACGKEMVKVYMENEGINLDICLNGCGGIYFDNREFDKYNEKHENIDNILKELENKTFEKVDSNDRRICPVCNSKMVKNFSSINKNIEIDECYTCGGKFLDNEELILIRNEFLNDEERANASLNYVNEELKKESSNKFNDNLTNTSNKINSKLEKSLFFNSGLFNIISNANKKMKNKHSKIINKIVMNKNL